MDFRCIGGLVLAATLAGCAAFPPSDAGERLVITAPAEGMAVIYLVRTDPDVSYLATPVVLNDQMIGSTYAGTYYRLEVPAGRQLLSGYAGDNGALRFHAESGRVYFIQHSVSGSWRATSPHSFFLPLDEPRGKAAVARADRLG